MRYTLIATAKNEGPYLLEWVAYHRLIGFDSILIFQNDSDDGTHETLRALADLGVVEYRYNRAGPGRHQVRAYKRAARQEAYAQADWAMALDLDEFLHLPMPSADLASLFEALPESDEVLVNWRRFGNGGALDITDDLVTARFTSAEAEARVAAHLTPYKAMFRPSLFDRAGVHRPAGGDGTHRVCNGSGLIEPAFTRHRFRATDPGKRAFAQVNHYIVRDAASFVLKSNRGSAHQSDREIGQKYWARRNFNDDQDAGLAARAPEIRAAMDALDAQSGGKLEALRRRSIKLHQERFARLIADPIYRDLYAFCSRAA